MKLSEPMKFISSLFFSVVIATSLGAEPQTFIYSQQNIDLAYINVSHDIKEEEYTLDIDVDSFGLLRALWGLSVFARSEGKRLNDRQYQFRESEIIIEHNGGTETRTTKMQDEDLLSFVNDAPVNITLLKEQYEGASDLVTGIYYILRNTTSQNICSFGTHIVDGNRLSRIVMGEPSLRADGRLECRGGFEMLSGYSEETLRDNPNIYFLAIYKQVKKDEYALDRIVGDNKYGPFRLLQIENEVVDGSH